MKRCILFLILYIFFNGLSHAQDCCAMPDCEKKADSFAKDLSHTVSALGPCSPDMNVANSIVSAYKIEHAEKFQVIHDLTLQYNKWETDTTTLSLVDCILKKITNEDVLDWLAYFNKIYTGASVFKSPEFEKGWAVYAELNQGATDMFKSEELHLLTIRTMCSYTVNNNKSNAIRYRLMLGPALYYSASEAFFYLCLRTEIRLWDLDAKKATIGNVKLIVHSNSNFKTVDGGLGIGIELNNFGLHLFPFDYDFKNQMYFIQIGFFYRVYKYHHKNQQAK